MLLRRLLWLRHLHARVKILLGVRLLLIRLSVRLLLRVRLRVRLYLKLSLLLLRVGLLLPGVGLTRAGKRLRVSPG
jgi:hypothetical protein